MRNIVKPRFLSDCIVVGLDDVIALKTGLSDESVVADDTMIDMLNHLGENIYIVIVTNRDMSRWDETVEWLDKNGMKWNELILRKRDDDRPNASYKQDVLENKVWKSYNVFWAIDADEYVIEMYLGRGIRCLHARDSQFEKGEN